MNQLELGFFDNLVRVQLDGKTIGRITTWTKVTHDDDDDDNIECKINYSTEGKTFLKKESKTFSLSSYT